MKNARNQGMIMIAALLLGTIVLSAATAMVQLALHSAQRSQMIQTIEGIKKPGN